MAAHEEDTSFFAPEYAYILNNADVLMQEFKRQPAKLERIYGNFINNVLLNHIYFMHEIFLGLDILKLMLLNLYGRQAIQRIAQFTVKNVFFVFSGAN